MDLEAHRKLNELLEELRHIGKKVHHMANELDALKAAVAKNTSVIGSAVALIQGFKAKLDAAIGDPAALQALSDELGKSDADLAQAVAANTPADPSATT